jgi:hypothetical protein
MTPRGATMKTKLIATLVILPIIALLYGCAVKVDDLRNSPKTTYTKDVDVNYQLAHKRILTKLRKCNGEGGAAGVQILSEIYSDIGESSIAWVISNGVENSYFLQIDLTSTGSEKTHIQAYAIHDGWQKTLNLLEPWSTDPNSTC